MQERRARSPEEWRSIPGHSGYSVSSWGVVLGLSGRPLRQNRRSDGHLDLQLGRGNRWKVHLLVLLAFVGPLPAGMETRHLDGDPGNNYLGNLCYGTRLENRADSMRHGTSCRPTIRGRLSQHGKLNEGDVAAIRELLAVGLTRRKIGRQFGVSHQSINAIASGKAWGWLPAG